MIGTKITSIENPGPLKVSGKLELLRKNGLYIGIAILLIAALLGYSMGFKDLFWKFYLVNLFFFLGLTFFGYIFSAIHYAANATWSSPIRRVAEGFTSFTYIGFAFVLLMFIFGASSLYDWTIDDIHHHFSASKGAYLSLTAYLIKLAAFFALIFFLGKKLISLSLKQDETGDALLSEKAKKVAIPFIFIFGYLFSLFVFDTLLAIDSKWFSTMFGVYCFIGIFVSGFAALGIAAVKLKENGELKKAAPKHVLKDLGTYMMGFSAFFAYIGFSQFMLVWYANMPAETFYFMERSQNGWDVVYILVALFRFIIPFVFLMPWGMRSNPKAFKVIGSIMIIGQWLDITWMVMPDFSNPPMAILFAVLTFLAFLVLFLNRFLSFFSKHSVLAHQDPRLLTSINGEYL